RKPRGRSEGGWAGGPAGPPVRLILDEGAEVAAAQRVAQLPERLGLDLPNTLTRDRETLADLLEGVLALFANAEPETQNLLLLRRRLAPDLVDHVPVHARDAVERLHHVDRDPDRPRVVGDRAGDGLADPPRRVRRELEAAAVLEPVDGLHEPDVAFLDEVEQRQVAAQVALGHRDDQSKIRLHQLALGLAHGSVASLDLLEELAQLAIRQADLLLEL